ncbi:HNH endonuclease [Streptomyces sp. NBC_01235]|uniref:HNH endonuclease n=1 Tax=Streptomyces sp. NBC_01235 TaxID=2903788 RepID=UPI002E15D013|nr:HNH endonuclease [Streptomyces sp. NBC_01235]
MGVRSASERSDAHSGERLTPEVAEARNRADLMRRLGLKPSGGQRRVLQEHVTRHGLDTGHFVKRSPWRKYPDAAIAEAAASSSSLREVALKLGARAQLHRALTEIGAPYACETCGNKGEWLGKAITLQIDHVNGEWRDNRRENLRHLCPNCHAPTETWCRQKERAPLAGQLWIPVHLRVPVMLDDGRLAALAERQTPRV